MARTLLAGVICAAALGAAGSATAGQVPIVRSLGLIHRHVVLQLSVGDLRPVEFSTATRRAVNADGALLPKNVRLQEAIQVPASASGVVRWQSPRALRPGTYFVQVTAVETAGGGVLDCPPKQPRCNDRWSSVRRVVVPK